MTSPRSRGLRRQTYFYLGFLAIVFATMAFEVTSLIRGPRVAGAIEAAAGALGDSEVIEQVVAPLDLVLKKLGVALAVLLVTIGLVMLLLMKRVTIPLENILDGARLIAAGDLSSTIPVHTHDELGSLADCINDLSANYQELLLLTGDISSRARETLHSTESNSGSSARQDLVAQDLVAGVGTVLDELDEVLEAFGRSYYDGADSEPPSSEGGERARGVGK